MKPILTPEEAVELDRATQDSGVPAELLMERAGRAVARAAVDLIGGTYGRRAVVVCGVGNNGGDGLVAARHLARWGVRVSVLLMGDGGPASAHTATNLTRLEEIGIQPGGWSASGSARELARADIAVDGIFGTGFHGIPEGSWADAIRGLNDSPAPVVAIDIPSGVDGSNGAIGGEAVRAALTVTFGAAKVGTLLLPGAEFAGAVRVVDIGFPHELVRAGAFLVEPSDVNAWLPERPPDTHKRASGVLLVVAGSRGMTGAPALVAEAAVRMGAGLVVLAAPAEILGTIQAKLSEATFLPLPATERGTIAREALAPILEALGRANALAIGPGLTTDDETAALVRDLVRVAPVPVVVDADALNAFTGRASELADRKADAVLTPHAGEFARLSGVPAADLNADRLGHARTLSRATGAVTLLKGSRTLVVETGGDVRINATGSAVLATAGSGDVLTGMIGGLVARGLEPVDAASAGAYLHGVAGIVAGRTNGEGTSAGDIVAAIPEAVARTGGS